MAKAQPKRSASSAPLEGPRLRLLPAPPPSADVLASAFISDRGIPEDVAPFVHLVIEVAHAHLRAEGRPGHWASLHPERFVLHWRARAPLPRDLADLQLLALASFFRWLADRGHVPRADGDALGWALLSVK